MGLTPWFEFGSNLFMAIGSQCLLPTKIPDPWSVVRDPGALKHESFGLGNISDVRIRSLGRGAGAMVTMAGAIQSKCLAMQKAAMNAAIILKLGVS